MGYGGGLCVARFRCWWGGFECSEFMKCVCSESRKHQYEREREGEGDEVRVVLVFLDLGIKTSFDRFEIRRVYDFSSRSEWMDLLRFTTLNGNTDRRSFCGGKRLKV